MASSRAIESHVSFDDILLPDSTDRTSRSTILLSLAIKPLRSVSRSIRPMGPIGRISPKVQTYNSPLIHEPPHLNADDKPDGDKRRQNGRQSGAHQRQWNADHGQKSERHSHVYKDL